MDRCMDSTIVVSLPAGEEERPHLVPQTEEFSAAVGNKVSLNRRRVTEKLHR